MTLLEPKYFSQSEATRTFLDLPFTWRLAALVKNFLPTYLRPVLVLVIRYTTPKYSPISSPDPLYCPFCGEYMIDEIDEIKKSFNEEDGYED